MLTQSYIHINYCRVYCIHITFSNYFISAMNQIFLSGCYYIFIVLSKPLQFYSGFTQEEIFFSRIALISTPEITLKKNQNPSICNAARTCSSY